MPASRPAFVTALMSLAFLAGSASPAGAQLAGASIEAAQKYSAARGGLCLVVKERGELRYEKYYNGHKPEQPVHIYSGTKSFFGALAVIAEKDGILSLDERVAETLPEWRDDPRKAKITIRELLDFTSGLETGFQQIYGSSSADKLTLSVGLEAKREHGEAFIYGPSHLQVFCEVLRRKLKRRGMTYQGYLERKLIRPLDIEIAQWRADNHGNVIPSAGMWMTARDWSRFGETVASGGYYQGREVVPNDGFGKCFAGTEVNPAFGLCFWVNRYCGQPDAREVDVEEWLDRTPLPEDWRRACLSKNAPPDLICSLGSNFQRLYVVPSMQLVVVHQGRKGAKGFRDADFLAILFRGADVPAAASAAPATAERKVKPLFPKGFGGLLKKPGQAPEGEGGN
jgi:hypothetical protein